MKRTHIIVTTVLVFALAGVALWWRTRPYTGERVFRWPNGRIRVVYAEVDGKVDGIHQKWHSNGVRQMETSYRNGEADGLFTIWDDNGQKTCQGTMSHGQRSGEWIYWYANGVKACTLSWQDGKPWNGAELVGYGNGTSWEWRLIEYVNGEKSTNTTSEDIRRPADGSPKSSL